MPSIKYAQAFSASPVELLQVLADGAEGDQDAWTIRQSCGYAHLGSSSCIINDRSCTYVYVRGLAWMEMVLVAT